MQIAIDVFTLWILVATIALAVATEWSVSRVPNFAVADIAVFSLILGEEVFGRSLAGSLAGVVVCLGVRIVVFRSLFSRLGAAGENTRVAAALGTSLVVVALSGMLFGTSPVERGPNDPRLIDFGGVAMPAGRAEALVSAGVILLAFAAWVRWSSGGRCLLLAAENLKLAMFGGLRLKSLAMASVAWSSVLAFAGVYVLTQLQLVGPHEGGGVTVLALSTAFIGRARPLRTSVAAMVVAIAAYTLGDALQVDVGVATALALAALTASLMDRRDPFRAEERV